MGGGAEQRAQGREQGQLEQHRAQKEGERCATAGRDRERLRKTMLVLFSRMVMSRAFEARPPGFKFQLISSAARVQFVVLFLAASPLGMRSCRRVTIWRNQCY